ncbi:MAG: LacI family DNA-binding transcriptional regulator [Lentisphaeria bacterium]
MKRNVTIKDVAKMASVSHPVVSAILNGKQSTVRFSETTRKRVVEAANFLNYKPNILAKSFQQKKSFLIGVLGFDVNSWLFTDLLEGIQQVTFSKSYAPIFLTHHTPEEERANLQICLDRMVDGLLVNATLDEEGVAKLSEYKELLADNVPIVELFGKGIEGAPSVIPYNYRIGKTAVEHLYLQGHRNIALITHDSYKNTSRNNGMNWDAWDQYRGYEDAMTEYDLRPIVITHPAIKDIKCNARWSEGGHQAAKKILFNKEKITAIICYNDYEAYGAIEALKQNGMRIPEDIAVVSNRDVGIGEINHPHLTTQQIDVRKIGSTAAELIFKMLDGEVAETTRLTNLLRIRESSDYKI